MKALEIAGIVIYVGDKANEYSQMLADTIFKGDITTREISAEELPGLKKIAAKNRAEIQQLINV